MKKRKWFLPLGPVSRWGLLPLLVAGMIWASPFSSCLWADEQPQAGAFVTIDLVARDKKGQTISDLKETEIEIREDGARQRISSLRLVNRSAISGAKVDPLQKVKLVTMVFEQLQASPESQKIALNAVQSLLDANPDPNVVVGAFTLDMRLNLVQQYTNKKDVIMNAAKRAVASSREDLLAKSETIQRSLVEIAKGIAVPQGKPELGGTGDQQLDSHLAQLTGQIMGHGDTQSSQGGWRTLLYSFRAIGQEQAALPGRKTLIYYSWGMWIPKDQQDILQKVTGTLNQAHVSVYAVYLAGLSMWSQGQSSKEALDSAVAASRAESAGGAATTWGASSRGEDATTANALQTMTDFSKATSGMTMGDTNDFSIPMKRLAEDINNYYEVSYIPQNPKADGAFHKVAVKIPRAKTVLARSGYLSFSSAGLAAPTPDASSAMLPYEAPMAEILNQPNPPHAFDYRIKMPNFEIRGGARHYSLVLEVPFSNVTLTPDEKTKKVRAQFGVLALIKDSDGKSVEKLSQFFPFENPIERMESLKQMNYVFNKDFFLPPGPYNVETVFLDKTSGKSSTLKTPLQVPPIDSGLHLSSLQVIKRAEPVAANDSDISSPYRVGKQKLNPFVEDPAPVKIGSGLILYFVVYLDSKLGDKPQMKLQVSQDGATVGEIPAELPAADTQGRIQYTGTVPTNSFPPGLYEFKAIVTQGNSKAETAVKVNLTQ